MGKNKEFTAMIHKLTEYLFYKKNLIEYDEIEEYKYGLEVMILKLIHFLLFFIFGIIHNCLIPLIIFLMIFSHIRSEVNGYHATTRFRCLIISFAMVISLYFCILNKIIDKEYLIFLNILLSLLLFKQCSKLFNKLSFLIIVMIMAPYNIVISIFVAELFPLILYYINAIKLKKDNENIVRFS